MNTNKIFRLLIVVLLLSLSAVSCTQGKSNSAEAKGAHVEVEDSSKILEEAGMVATLTDLKAEDIRVFSLNNLPLDKKIYLRLYQLDETGRHLMHQFEEEIRSTPYQVVLKLAGDSFVLATSSPKERGGFERALEPWQAQGSWSIVDQASNRDLELGEEQIIWLKTSANISIPDLEDENKGISSQDFAYFLSVEIR